MDTAVGLVKSYLELCGYFVLAELPVRKLEGSGFRDVTDIDIVAVRFPHPPASHLDVGASPLHLLLGCDPQLGTFERGVDVIIGEVKEGRAELNPALHRQETIEFALRRLGCCPARSPLFAGHGVTGASRVFTLPLRRCAQFIEERMKLAPQAMIGTQWKDPTLAMFALLSKVGAEGPAGGQSTGFGARSPIRLG